MATKIATRKVQELTRLCSILKSFPVRQMNLRYDDAADVLYVKFADTAPIKNSELTRDDILIEYDAKKNIVGVTILDASKR